MSERKLTPNAMSYNINEVTNILRELPEDVLDKLSKISPRGVEILRGVPEKMSIEKIPAYKTRETIIKLATPDEKSSVEEFVNNVQDPMLLEALEAILKNKFPVFIQSGPITYRKFGLSRNSIAFKRGPGVLITIVSFPRLINFIRELAIERLKGEKFDLSIKEDPKGAL